MDGRRIAPQIARTITAPMIVPIKPVGRMAKPPPVMRLARSPPMKEPISPAMRASPKLVTTAEDQLGHPACGHSNDDDG